MVKLIYVHGEFGQVARPDGKRYEKTDTDYKGKEEYASKQEAIKVAKAYVKKFPLNCCHIYDENNDCEEIHGDEQLHNEAVEELKKKRAEFYKKENIRKRNKTQIIMFIISISFYLVYKFY